MAPNRALERYATRYVDINLYLYIGIFRSRFGAALLGWSFCSETATCFVHVHPGAAAILRESELASAYCCRSRGCLSFACVCFEPPKTFEAFSFAFYLAGSVILGVLKPLRFAMNLFSAFKIHSFLNEFVVRLPKQARFVMNVLPLCTTPLSFSMILWVCLQTPFSFSINFCWS